MFGHDDMMCSVLIDEKTKRINQTWKWAICWMNGNNTTENEMTELFVVQGTKKAGHHMMAQHPTTTTCNKMNENCQKTAEKKSLCICCFRFRIFCNKLTFFLLLEMVALSQDKFIDKTRCHGVASFLELLHTLRYHQHHWPNEKRTT